MQTASFGSCLTSAQKRENKTGLVEAVKQVCDEGEALAGTINQFFPNFTLHNEKHIQNVCNWMIKLLGKEKKKDASIRELAMLVMSACCHDIGMAVNDEQKEYLRKLASSEVDQSWQQFFEKHPKFYLELKSTGNVSDEMLRSYVRENHPSRVAEQLKNWSPELTLELLLKNELLELCKSHGFGLSTIDSSSRVVDPDLDLAFCAILLRLSDILDYDASRAPKRLLEFKGLDNPVSEEDKTSTTEWIKNRIGSFHLMDGVLLYSAEFSNPGIEHDINGYLDWVDEELKVCRGYLSRHVTKWNGFDLPTMVTRKTTSMGYETGDFRLTMDQDGVLELLSGESLYDKPGVFVRELLQNAIDAVLTRVQLDPTFSEKDGRIDVRTWYDPKDYRYAWFSITDNGIGMDKHAIESYFLKVGRSYYCSDEYKSDIVACGGDSTALPISRFGIGILSCFMGGSNNQLEVVTRRYSHGKDSNPVYRLDVTGLHGYYVLSQLDATHHGLTSIRDESINKPLPPKQDNTHEIGTTVYVKVDMYAFGETDVFRSLLDECVCFPRVRVVYNGGESDERVYPIQSELMDKVYALNPDGRNKPLKQYRYPISDEAFEQIRYSLSELDWKDKPTVVIRYIPLDWFTESKQVNGIIISYDLECDNNGKYITIKRNGADQSGYFSIDIKRAPRFEISGKRVNFATSISDSCSINASLNSKDGDSRSISSLFSLETAPPISLEKASVEERALLSVLGIPSFPNNENELAFEGILIMSRRPFGSYSVPSYLSFLLLNGSYRPEANLARNSLIDLPVETRFALELIENKLKDNGLTLEGGRLPIDLSIYSTNTFVVGKTCKEILNKNPSWINDILIAGKSFRQLDEEIEANGFAIIPVDGISNPSLLCKLSQFHLQSQYKVSAVFEDWNGELHAKNLSPSEENPEAQYLEFPPNLFFLDMAPLSELGIVLGSCVLLNKSHPFVGWLTQQSCNLNECVPALYQSILGNIAIGHSRRVIVDLMNKLIDKLKSFPRDPFEVSHVKHIKKEEIIEYSPSN